MMGRVTSPYAASVLDMELLERNYQFSDQPPERIHKACSRCHRQKLRCLRTNGQPSCERCMRLKISCRPRALGSFKHRELAADFGGDNDGRCELISSTELESAPDLSFDELATDLMATEWAFSPHGEGDIDKAQAPIISGFWYSMPGYPYIVQNNSKLWPANLAEPTYDEYMLHHSGSLDIGLTQVDTGPISNSSIYASQRDPNDQMGSIEYCGPGPERSSLATVGETLARLSASLFECAAKLPNLTKAGEVITSTCIHRTSRAQTLFVIDELFKLTKEFINALKCLLQVDCEMLARIPQANQNQASFPRMTHLITEVMNSGESLGQSHMGTSSSTSQVDEATTFALMACHCKLTEIYASLFQMMEACINHSLFPNMRDDWAIVLPKLEVGSIISPPVQVDVNRPLSPPGASTIYMVLVTLISSQLWENLRNLTVTREHDDSSEFSRTVGNTLWESMSHRTDRMSKSIDATKYLLQGSAPSVSRHGS